jgi:hypothetical protein
MKVEIINVTNTKRGMKQFLKLPWVLYKDDPFWAPDLIMDLKKRLNKKKHPFFEFGDAEFYLAKLDRKIVGRIAAIENRNHVEYRKENIGFWGFFECINDQGVANTLFAAAKKWNLAKGYESMRGPMSCDTQDEVGMVLEGYDYQRYFIMPHTPPYYIELCKKAGFEKVKDLICFQLNIENAIPEKIARIAEISQQRLEKRGFRFRNANKKALVDDFRGIMKIYHESWKENWGFVPASERQFIEMAANMKLVADSNLVILIEGPEDPETKEREPVAMAVSLYDWMVSTKWARKFPFWMQETMQLLSLVRRLFLKHNNKFPRVRMFLAGVNPKYRGQGIDSLLYVLPFKSAKELGIKDAELSWELEDNYAILSPIEKIGGKLYRKLRIWDIKTS